MAEGPTREPAELAAALAQLDSQWEAAVKLAKDYRPATATTRGHLRSAYGGPLERVAEGYRRLAAEASAEPVAAPRVATAGAGGIKDERLRSIQQAGEDIRAALTPT